MFTLVLAQVGKTVDGKNQDLALFNRIKTSNDVIRIFDKRGFVVTPQGAKKL